MEAPSLFLVGVVFLAAGVVKGVSGMGLPTFSMALLGLFMPPAEAAALMVLPSLATNVSQCGGPFASSLARRLWPLWVGLFATALFSPLPDLGASGQGARVVLGAVLIAYGVWGLVKPSLPDTRGHTVLAGSLAGILSGILTAATGVFVMPLVPYLQSLKLAKEELIQALGLSFTIATIALAVRLGHTGASVPFDPVGLVTGTASAFMGLFVGAWLRHRMRAEVFQRALYLVFSLIGMIMLARAL
jgi:uncharacterized membrane protein YfcA